MGFDLTDDSYLDPGTYAICDLGAMFAEDMFDNHQALHHETIDSDRDLVTFSIDNKNCVAFRTRYEEMSCDMRVNGTISETIDTSSGWICAVPVDVLNTEQSIDVDVTVDLEGGDAELIDISVMRLPGYDDIMLDGFGHDEAWAGV